VQVKEIEVVLLGVGDGVVTTGGVSKEGLGHAYLLSYQMTQIYSGFLSASSGYLWIIDLIIGTAPTSDTGHASKRT
jgi:hypothetical protein